LLQHNFFSVASKTTKQTKLLKMAAVKAEAKYAAVPEDEEGAQATAAVAVAIKKETDDEAPSLSSDAHDVKENKSQLEVEGQPWKQGERQQPAFRDKWFVVVFLLHLMAIIATAITLGSNVFSNSALDDSSFNGNSEDPKMTRMHQLACLEPLLSFRPSCRQPCRLLLSVSCPRTQSSYWSFP
jgi:hypothetical protein